MIGPNGQETLATFLLVNLADGLPEAQALQSGLAFQVLAT
jgi:hypothetical protein